MSQQNSEKKNVWISLVFTSAPVIRLVSNPFNGSVHGEMKKDKFISGII